MGESRKFLMAASLLLVIILATSYYLIKEGQEDSYTVLYFSNPVEPLSYSESEKIIKVNFLVENQENTDLKYVYTILVDDLELAREDVTVKNNEKVVISEDVYIEEFGEGPRVSVHLYKEGINEPYRNINYQVKAP